MPGPGNKYLVGTVEKSVKGPGCRCLITATRVQAVIIINRIIVVAADPSVASFGVAGATVIVKLRAKQGIHFRDTIVVQIEMSEAVHGSNWPEIINVLACQTQHLKRNQAS